MQLSPLQIISHKSPSQRQYTPKLRITVLVKRNEQRKRNKVNKKHLITANWKYPSLHDDVCPRHQISRHGFSGCGRKNPSTMLLSRTVIVTPEHAVTSVTQTASSTRFDAGCQIGELTRITWSLAVSVGCSHTSGSFPTFGNSVAGVSCTWCFGGERLSVSGGGWNDCLAASLTFDLGRLTNRRAIPRGPCFLRFFTTTGGCFGDRSGAGGFAVVFTVVWPAADLPASVVGGGGFSGSAAKRDGFFSSILRFSVDASGGRPRGRFTPSMLTFFACCTAQIQP